MANQLDYGFELPLRKSKKVGGAEKWLYLEIKYRVDENNLCHTTNRFFADFFNVDERTIRRWIETLTKQGFVKVYRQKRNGLRVIEPVFVCDKVEERNEKIEDERITKFKQAWPSKRVGKVTSIPDWFDIDKINEAIAESTFLKTNGNVTLKSCIDNYRYYIAGNYKDYPKTSNGGRQFKSQRHYTEGEMLSCYQSIEEIEI